MDTDPIEAVGPKQVGVESGNALILATAAKTRSLAIAVVRSALAGHSESLGVSVGWLAKHVEQLNLNAQDVEELARVKTEFGGLLPHAVKFLYQGLTSQEVCGCYQTRNELVAQELPASVKKIARLCRMFSDVDPIDNEVLAEMIARAHAVISGRYFWVRYVDQSMHMLSAVPEQYECCTLEAALGMIESRHPKKMGVVSDDDEGEDEVERHRGNWEKRKEAR